MGTAGYLAVVKLAGTATAFTGEPCTGAGVNTYQITDETKQVWDRNAEFSFEEDGIPIPSEEIESIDTLFGRVIFTSARSGSITATGEYLPMITVANARQYDLSHTGDLLDDTTYDSAQADGGNRSRTYGLRDVSLTLGRLWAELETDGFQDAIDNSLPLVLEVRPGGGNEISRGWYVIEADALSGDISALEEINLTFQLDGDVDGNYGWSV